MQKTLKKERQVICSDRQNRRRSRHVAVRERRAANAADHRHYHALERRHNAVARARDVAFAQCVEEAEHRRSAETLTVELQASVS